MNAPNVGVASCDHWCKVCEPSIGLTICSFSGSRQVAELLPLKPLRLPLLPVDMMLSGVRQPNGTKPGGVCMPVS